MKPLHQNSPRPFAAAVAMALCVAPPTAVEATEEPSVCYVDLDGDGYGDDDLPVPPHGDTCFAGTTAVGGDCNNFDSTIHPGAIDLCNGVDDDCDGFVDPDYPAAGESCARGTGACRNEGVLDCSVDGLALLCSAADKSPAPEQPNGVDDDCDGFVDEELVLAMNVPVSTGSCTRDEALLFSLPPCGTDDLCPCGSFCFNLQCVFECLGDADCTGDEVCNDEGRCAEADATDDEVTLSKTPVVWPKAVEISRAEAPRRIRVSAWNGAVGAVRIVLSGPEQEAGQGTGDSGVPARLTMRCGGKDEAEASVCELAGLAEGDSYDLWVSADSLPGEAETYSINVTTGGKMASVSVTLVAPDAWVEQPIEGRYEGTLTVTAAGVWFQERGPVTHPMPAGIEIPVSAAIVTKTYPEEIPDDASEDRVLVLYSDGNHFGRRVIAPMLVRPQEGGGYRFFGLRKTATPTNMRFHDGTVTGGLTFRESRTVLVMTLVLRRDGDVDEAAVPHRDETVATEPWTPFGWSTFVREWVADLSTVRAGPDAGDAVRQLPAGDFVETWYSASPAAYDSIFLCDAHSLYFLGTCSGCIEFGEENHCRCEGCSNVTIRARRPSRAKHACYIDAPYDQNIEVLYTDFGPVDYRSTVCAQRYLCFRPGADNASLSGGAITDVRDQGEGAFNCRVSPHGDEAIVSAMPFLESAALQSSAATSELIQDCVSELSRTPPWQRDGAAPWEPAEVPADSRTFGASAEDIFITSPSCIGLARVMPALSWAAHKGAIGWVFSEDDEAEDQVEWASEKQAFFCWPGYRNNGTNPETGLFFRLLHQWLQLHGFVASQGRQAVVLRDALQLGADASSVTGYEALLSVVEASWTVFSEPTIVAALERFGECGLATADYIAFWDGGATGESYNSGWRGDRPIGLPPRILETAAAHLELLDTYLQSAAFDVEAAREQARRHGARGFHQALLALALSEGLFNRALEVEQGLHAHGGEPRGHTDWAVATEAMEAGRNMVGSLLARVAAQLHALSTGHSPFGIEETDIPLSLHDGGGQTPWERYARLSYLMLGGPGATTEPIAASAIAEAITAQENAFGAWASFNDRADVTADEVRETESYYGEQILALCGGSKASWEQLDHWDPDGDGELDRSVLECIIDVDQGSCDFDEDLLKSRLGPADAKYNVCVAAAVRAKYGAPAHEGDPSLAGFLDEASAYAADVIAASRLEEWSVGNEAWDYLWPLEGPYEDTLEFLEDGVWNTDRLAPPSDEELLGLSRACARMFPEASGSKASWQDVGLAPEQRPECFRGGLLAELAVARNIVAKDIEIAVADMDGMMGLYDTSVNGCLMERELNELLADVQEAHQQTMVKLRKKKARARGVLASWTSFGFGLRSANAELAEQEAETRHAFVVQQLTNHARVQQCMNEASKHLAGFTSAAKRIERAQLDGVAVEQKYRGTVERLLRLVSEGRAAVKREKARGDSLVAFQHRRDMNLRTALNKMRHAKRMAYLGLLTAEFDLQMSIGLCSGLSGNGDCRRLILSASHPQQLEAVNGSLAQHVIHATVAGGTQQMAMAREILSLRDELLALVDNRDLPPGYKQLEPAERFRMLLTDERFAHYGRDGSYLGQLIPFSLRPLWTSSSEDVGAELADESIPLYLANLCAERIWTVAAEVQGDVFDDRSEFVRLELWKRNTFSSRRCEVPSTGERLQTVASRPHVNLFRDPSLATSGGAPPNAAHLDYTAITLSAYQGIPGFDGPEGSYTGQALNSQLSGYGLLGDYALFVHRDALTGDFGLENLEDIRLRIEYYATTSRP